MITATQAKANVNKKLNTKLNINVENKFNNNLKIIKSYIKDYINEYIERQSLVGHNEITICFSKDNFDADKYDKLINNYQSVPFISWKDISMLDNDGYFSELKNELINNGYDVNLEYCDILDQTEINGVFKEEYFKTHNCPVMIIKW